MATVGEMRERIRRKSKLKGRQVDHASLQEVRVLIGSAPCRRDLLIEWSLSLATMFARASPIPNLICVRLGS